MEGRKDRWKDGQTLFYRTLPATAGGPTNDINVKAFDMITHKNEAKAMTEHISCDCKCKFNSTMCNSNQKWNNKTCQCELKIIVC